MVYGSHVCEKITLMTDHERIEGTIVFSHGLRMSDVFNAEIFRNSPFLKITAPSIHSRTTGEPIACGSFLMVAKEKIVYITVE